MVEPLTKTKTVEIEVLVCPKCGYEWEAKAANPVKCPSCQRRFTADRAPRAGQGAATNDAKETK